MTGVVERPAPMVDVQVVAERRRAARALLLRPLLTAAADADDLGLVRRHAAHLQQLFAEGLGYRLVVDPGAARLFKSGLGHDATRPLRRASGPAFTPRAYAMLCLTVAALTRSRSQLLVDELVTQVRSAAADAGVAVDLDGTADRRALHAALVALVRLGALRERDGDLEHWADQGTASLLDVRRDVLPLLVAASLAPATGPEELLATSALPSAAGGARVAVRRRLVEQPLLTTDDLTDDQAEWWRRNRNREREWFSDRFGLELELRAEGALAVDPEESLTDEGFPGRGSAKHLALLLLEQLTEVARADATGQAWRAVGVHHVQVACEGVLVRWGAGLSKAHREAPRAAIEEAIDLLVAFGLVRRDGGGGVLVHAAAARYATRTTLADASSSGERSLFDTDDGDLP